MKKTVPLFTLVFLFLIAPRVSAYPNICEDENPTCCLPPGTITDGGGCPAGEVWIGGPLEGACQIPVACAAPALFNCATNTCDTSGNSCLSTTSIETDLCCAQGQVAIRDSNSDTGWTCGDSGGVSSWLEGVFGPYTDDKEVGIGVDTLNDSGYSLHVRADASNAATLGAILANAVIPNSVGIQASGTRAGGVFNGSTGVALEVLNGNAFLVHSGDGLAAGVKGSFKATAGSNQVQLGSASNHDVAIQRNSTSYVDVVNTGTRQYVRFSQGTDAAPATSESGSVIVGSPTGAHLVLDSNEVMAKSNGTTSSTLYLNDGGNVIISPTVSSATNLCIDGSNRIATCSSSQRYKENIASFESALGFVKKLRPVWFDWIKSDEVGVKGRDFGFIAEEVEKVFPEAVTHKEGRVQSVKYDQLVAVAIKAIQEQQQMIETQQEEIDALKSLVCLDHPEAKACQ